MSVADGLGHGPHAFAAALAAVSVTPRPEGGCLRLLEDIHLAVRRTRGAAVAVAQVRAGRSTVNFAGMGNVSGAIVQGSDRRHTVSSNGTLGHGGGSFREFSYPWAAGALLVLHTDGITSHWSADTAVALSRHHPSVIAAALYRDFWRGRDDATVIIVKEGR